MSSSQADRIQPDTVSPRDPDADERVCPSCGLSAGSASFCGQCGLNLSTVDRFPTREQWEREVTLSQDAEAQAIVDRLAGVDAMAAGIFEVAPAERRLNNPAAAEVVERSITNAVESRILRSQRSAVVAIQTSRTMLDPMAMIVMARVVLTGGRSIEQGFDCVLQPGKPRVSVTRSGSPTLLHDDTGPGVLKAPEVVAASAIAATSGHTRPAGFGRGAPSPGARRPGWYVHPRTGSRQWWDGYGWEPPRSGSSLTDPDTQEGSGIQIGGYICAGLSALMPLLGLPGLILGILTATKRGRGGHGAAIIILSIVVSGIAAVIYYNLFLHHAAASSGSCYFDTSGNYICR